MMRLMRRLGTALALVAAVLLLTPTLFGALIVPARMVDVVHPGITDLDHRLAQEAALRTTMIGFLGGLGVIGGRSSLASTSVRPAGRRAVLELQRRGQVTERYTRAIDQLRPARDEKRDVRIGAVYTKPLTGPESSPSG